MNRSLATWLAAGSCISAAVMTFTPALAQPGGSFLGRWDITLTSPNRTWGQWMEVAEKDGKLGGRVQPAAC